MALLKPYRLFVLDLDGTFYLGDRLLPGSLAFLDAVTKAGADYLFLTNNSSKTRVQYIQKLRSLGVATDTGHLLTSADATQELLLKETSWRSIHLLATPPVCREFEDLGFRLTSNRPDMALLAFDTSLTYDKLRELCRLVREGAPYWATHPDINCPTPDGPIPDTGAMIAMVEASTGRRPDRIIGKPSGDFLAAACLRKNVSPSQVLMIGDRLYTDIQCGRNAGADTALVLSGETTIAMLEKSEVKPDHVFKGLFEMIDMISPIASA